MYFYINSVKVKIEFSFVIVLLFAILCGLDNVQKVILFSSLHELGHIVALIFTGHKLKQIKFSYFGLALSYDNCLAVSNEIFVIVSGPIINIILWFITHDEINALLFFLNILPVFPLDGGRIINLIFIERDAKVISIITLFCLILISIYLMIFFKSFSLFLISIYLVMFNIQK